jgi:hypothetical protein
LFKQIRTIYTWNWTCQVHAIIHSFGWSSILHRLIQKWIPVKTPPILYNFWDSNGFKCLPANNMYQICQVQGLLWLPKSRSQKNRQVPAKFVYKEPIFSNRNCGLTKKARGHFSDSSECMSVSYCMLTVVIWWCLCCYLLIIYCNK